MYVVTGLPHGATAILSEDAVRCLRQEHGAVLPAVVALLAGQRSTTVRVVRGATGTLIGTIADFRPT